MNGFFVTATDTGVGKTEVACALLRAGRAAGVDAVGMKPAQSGLVPGEPSDAERLHEASGRVEPLAAVCPYTLVAPLAPAVAARLEGRTLTVYVMTVTKRGIYEMHSYARTLAPDGSLQLLFTRIRDGERVRKASGTLKRVKT